MKVWGVGSDVTYETVDVPFIMYLDPDTKNEEIETALHKQALVLAKEMPNSSILIYGIVSPDNMNKGKTMLLTNDELRRAPLLSLNIIPRRIVHCRIRFLNSEFEKHQPLSAIGANLVRTALESYRKDYGKAPPQIECFLQDYPNNYLSFIPLEAVTGSNEISTVFNGRGGWVYDPNAADVEQMFYANAAGVGRVPYEPVHIEINKAEHQLKLVSGSYLLWV